MTSSCPADRVAWVGSYLEGVKGGLRSLLDSLRNKKGSPVRFQDPKPSAAVTRNLGPMLYIGQQIVKRMGKMGYPSKIAEHYRTPERQQKLYNSGKGVTGARAWSSPHQYYEAVDIVHKTLNWDAPPEYWDALAVCVRVIEADLRVKLVHGHTWKMVDSAHIELADWREVRQRQFDKVGYAHEPTAAQLLLRWREVLPSISPDLSTS